METEVKTETPVAETKVEETKPETIGPVFLQVEKVAEVANLSGLPETPKPQESDGFLITIQKRQTKDGIEIWRVHRQNNPFYHWIMDYSQASARATSLFVEGDTFTDDGR